MCPPLCRHGRAREIGVFQWDRPSTPVPVFRWDRNATTPTGRGIRGLCSARQLRPPRIPHKAMPPSSLQLAPAVPAKSCQSAHFFVSPPAGARGRATFCDNTQDPATIDWLGPTRHGWAQGSCDPGSWATARVQDAYVGGHGPRGGLAHLQMSGQFGSCRPALHDPQRRRVTF